MYQIYSVIELDLLQNKDIVNLWNHFKNNYGIVLIFLREKLLQRSILNNIEAFVMTELVIFLMFTLSKCLRPSMKSSLVSVELRPQIAYRVTIKTWPCFSGAYKNLHVQRTLLNTCTLDKSLITRYQKKDYVLK